MRKKRWILRVFPWILVAVGGGCGHIDDAANLADGTISTVETEPDMGEGLSTTTQSMAFGPDLRPAGSNAFALEFLSGCDARILIENNGSLLAGPSKVKIRWHTTSDGTPTEVQADVPAIPAGESRYSAVIPGLRLFSNRPNVVFWITADSNDDVVEFGGGENNNTKKFAWDEDPTLLPSSCVARPDLVVQSIEWTPSCMLNVKVKNYGTADSSESGGTGFFVRISNIVTPAGATDYAYNHSGVLKKGATTAISIAGYRAITSTTPTRVFVDQSFSYPAHGMIFESVEVNNEISIMPPAACVSPTPPPSHSITPDCSGLYAVHHDDPSQREYIAKLNPDNGSVIFETEIVNVFDPTAAIACVKGTMYLKHRSWQSYGSSTPQASTLYTLDVITGVKTQLATFGIGESLGSSSGGNLIFAEKHSNNPKTYIHVLNPSNLMTVKKFSTNLDKDCTVSDIASSSTSEHLASISCRDFLFPAQTSYFLARIDVQYETLTILSPLSQLYEGFEIGNIQGLEQYIGGDKLFSPYFRTVTPSPIFEQDVYPSVETHDLAWGDPIGER